VGNQVFAALIVIAALSACKASDRSMLNTAAAACGIRDLKVEPDPNTPRRYLANLPFVTGGFGGLSAKRESERQRTNSRIDCLNSRLSGSGISVVSAFPAISY
jgi:hypothetical protein